jgi:hypothetical protein
MEQPGPTPRTKKAIDIGRDSDPLAREIAHTSQDGATGSQIADGVDYAAIGSATQSYMRKEPVNDEYQICRVGSPQRRSVRQ